MTRQLTALVTAGGTTQPIDDIRGISNISKGGFGTRIARSLARRGVETRLVGSDVCIDRLRKQEPFQFEVFRSFADLQAILTRRIAEDPPDFLFMAAAVSDFTPVVQEGKISSDTDELLVRCTRNPKILPTLREQCGSKTFIVGFKLLSGVTPEDLFRIALQQLKSSRLNLTIANDVREIDFVAETHPIVLVTPEGGAFPIDGHRVHVTEQLVDFVLERQDVDWFRTKQVAGPERAAGCYDSHPAGRLLRLAQEANLLVDSNGNISHRVEGALEPNEVNFLVSPRQVNKAETTPDELAHVSVDLSSRIITCTGPRKSSIDSGVQAVLYQHLPHIESFLHFHPGTAIVLPDITTDEAYPCGTVQEADTVLSALAKARLADYRHYKAFMAHLVNHGFVLAMTHDGVAVLEEEWRAATNGYMGHLAKVGELDQHDKLCLSPIFIGPSIAGVIAEHQDGWYTLWLLDQWRGRGYGEAIVKIVIERGYTVAAHDNCAVVNYYLDRGFGIKEKRGNLTILTSPIKRDDLREASSICLVNPKTKKVLLGRRLVEPWLGLHCFPGGGTEPNEQSMEGALREFEEETGWTLQRAKPAATSTHYLGWNGGKRAYRVRNFIFLTFADSNLPGSTELDCRWHPLTTKVDMGFATKAIIRQAQELLHI